MATTTIRQGLNGQIAIKSADNVTAYAWWVHDPANGGYPVTDDATVADWPETELEWPTPADEPTP